MDRRGDKDNAIPYTLQIETKMDGDITRRESNTQGEEKIYTHCTRLKWNYVGGKSYSPKQSEMSVKQSIQRIWRHW